MSTFTKYQSVSYINGGVNIQSGTVKAISNDGLHATIINENDTSLLTLWNGGYAVGDYIHISQLVNK